MTDQAARPTGSTGIITDEVISSNLDCICMLCGAVVEFSSSNLVDLRSILLAASGCNHDPYRPPPNRYYDARRQPDNYGSPGRNNHHRQGSYDRIYGGSPRNHHQFHHQYPHRGMPKDHKDMRMNGPRHMGNAGPGQVGMQEVESPDYRPSPEVLAELQEQFLFPLKKKSIRFPKAKYFCRLCDYHCDSLIVCRRHIADARHRKLKEAKDVETTLKNVPSPIEAQVAAVES
nr:terminal uridylyltransferase 7-like [Penaeus vannamei]